MARDRTGLMHPKMGGAIRRLLDLMWPGICAGCGREGDVLCPACRPGLGRRNGIPGAWLGLPSEAPLPLVQLEWCAPYRGVARRALHLLKYAGEQRLAEPLGSALAERWAEVGTGATLIVPIPVPGERLRLRGYDQAVLLARAAAQNLNLPVVEALERVRFTTPQFDLDRPSRAVNVRGAFRVRAQLSGSLGGTWTLLVDDVTTTGATLVAAAETLLAGGALAVSALTVAREQ